MITAIATALTLAQTSHFLQFITFPFAPLPILTHLPPYSLSIAGPSRPQAVASNMKDSQNHSAEHKALRRGKRGWDRSTSRLGIAFAATQSAEKTSRAANCLAKWPDCRWDS